MLKRFFKSAFAAALASWLIGAYIRLVAATGRTVLVDRRHFDIAFAEGRGVIFAFWHGRLMATPMLARETDAPIYMLISNHRDGDIIANSVAGFGVQFIRGSAANPKKPEKSKRGASAIAQMLAALGEGAIVGVTPDGPRGPGERVQAGVLKLAQLSAAPIVPVGVSASRGRRFKSWDRFLLAFPFSKIAFAAGPAVRVPKEISPDEVEPLRCALEKALLEVTARADKEAGRNDGEEQAP